MIAFKCNKCGHCTNAGAAGEHATPLACPVCKAGVTFDAADVEARDQIKAEMREAALANDGERFDQLVLKLHNLPLKKEFDPDNWTVLADLPEEEIRKLGHDPKHVERHCPFRTTATHGPEYEESYTHTGPRADPKSCVACRHAGKKHADGTTEPVTLKDAVHHYHVAEASESPPAVSTHYERGAEDCGKSADVASA